MQSSSATRILSKAAARRLVSAAGGRRISASLDAAGKHGRVHRYFKKYLIDAFNKSVF
jgi:hypothetical protein